MITIYDNTTTIYTGDFDEFLELNNYDAELEEIFSVNQHKYTFSFIYNGVILTVEKELCLF